MIKKLFKVIPVLLISSIFLLYGSKGTSSANAGKGAATVRVEKIYDGDTIAAFVDGQFQKIRLIGIDAPEMEQRPWGRKAKECIEVLITDFGLEGLP